MKLFSRRPRTERIEEDPTGVSQAIRDFNEHSGPARIFYNRNARTFYVLCYEPGAERWWSPDMCNGIDQVELYRKTTDWPDVKVTREELLMMEREIQPYSVW